MQREVFPTIESSRLALRHWLPRRSQQFDFAALRYVVNTAAVPKNAIRIRSGKCCAAESRLSSNCIAPHISGPRKSRRTVRLQLSADIDTWKLTDKGWRGLAVLGEPQNIVKHC